jgi:hypothetical protein
METINERLQLIVDQCYKGKKAPFYREAGIPQKTFADYISGPKNTPKQEQILKILSVKTFKINPEWLMYGRGEMILKDVEKDIEAVSLIDKEIAERDMIIKLQKMQIDQLTHKIEVLIGDMAVMKHINETKDQKG